MYYPISCYTIAALILLYVLFRNPRRKVDLKDRARRMKKLKAWRRERVYIGADRMEVRRTPWRDTE